MGLNIVTVTLTMIHNPVTKMIAIYFFFLSMLVCPFFRYDISSHWTSIDPDHKHNIKDLYFVFDVRVTNFLCLRY